jgi:hypothetical protein
LPKAEVQTSNDHADHHLQLPPPKSLNAITWLWRVLNRPKNNTPAPAALPLPAAGRVAASLAETAAFDPADPATQPETILYLAYGSNMCRETFQGRRGIRPLSAVNVIAPSLKLTFDLPGLPYQEPCFANSAVRTAADDDAALDPTLAPAAAGPADENTALLPGDGADTADPASRPLIGVVYEVTAADYAHIIATEGPTYADVLVPCTALPTPNAAGAADDDGSPRGPDGAPLRAHTLLAPPSATRHPSAAGPAQPSLRYLTLLRDGAAEHALPDAWRAYLAQLQHYEMTTARQRWGRTLLLLAWAPAMMAIFGLRRRVSDARGKPPAWFTALSTAMFKGMWGSYDLVWRRLFGEGERTIKK